MIEFWFDTDSFVTPSRGPYRFDIMPQFWEFLEQKAKEQVIGSSYYVFKELISGDDPLKTWAKQQQDILFLVPNQAVQKTYSQVVERVDNNKRFSRQNVTEFLDSADPWVIAYAKTLGGRAVTFEKPEPNSKKPKIPDICAEFNIKCINLYDLLSELKVYSNGLWKEQ